MMRVCITRYMPVLWNILIIACDYIMATRALTATHFMGFVIVYFYSFLDTALFMFFYFGFFGFLFRRSIRLD